MEKDDISLGDINRILFGEAPVFFLIEVFIRSVITYIILLAILKLMGKRMSGKLTHTEMAVMLMFGAIVSSAMQIPERGIIEGCFILVLVLIFQRGLTLWTVQNKRVENVVLGEMILIVKDGAIVTSALQKELISQRQLFRLLRSRGIRHLGEVKRLYLETSGSFSLYKFKDPPAGLSIYPEQDQELRKSLKNAEHLEACSFCGKTYMEHDRPTICDTCLSQKWEKAIL